MEKHIIFDLDGTLIDSKPEIEDTYRQIFLQLVPKNGVNYDLISYTATLQANLEIIYENDIALIQQAKFLFSAIYDNSFFKNTVLYEGVYDTLKLFHDKKYSIHIATNKRLTPTLRILEKKELSLFINSVKASDQTFGKVTSKEDMVRQIFNENNLRTGFMIGDSEKDIEAGQACGLTTVAVSYGYEKKEDLIKKNPTFVIDSFVELIDIINNKNTLID